MISQKLLRLRVQIDSQITTGQTSKRHERPKRHKSSSTVAASARRLALRGARSGTLQTPKSSESSLSAHSSVLSELSELATDPTALAGGLGLRVGADRDDVGGAGRLGGSASRSSMRRRFRPARSASLMRA